MASTARSLPLRVGVIAAAITVVLALLLLAVNRLGRPATPNDALSAGAPGEDAGLGLGPDAPAADQAGQVATEPVTLQLYLIDSANRRLVSRIRRLEAPLTLAAKAQVAIEQLISTVGSPLPRGTQVREVWVSTAGVAYVDFAASLQDALPSGSLPEILAVYGVVGTLTRSFPQIRAVQFLVDGRGVDTLTGHFDLAGPISPNRDWL